MIRATGAFSEQGAFPVEEDLNGERGWGQHPVGVSTSDFDGERAAIKGGGVREQVAFPVEENLQGEGGGFSTLWVYLPLTLMVSGRP